MDVSGELLKIARLLTGSNKVWIFDMDKSEAYVAKSRSDCKDNTDKSVYDEVMKMDDSVTMGKIIGFPERLWGRVKNNLKKV